MHIRELGVESIRCLSQVDLSLSPQLNLFVGANGAGKTSLLEAVFCGIYGISFRERKPRALIQQGSSRLGVRLDVDTGTERFRLRRIWSADAGWSVETESNAVADRVGSMFAAVAFSPNSHAFIEGEPAVRRRFVDQAVFHVEPSAMQTISRYRRALRQRNTLLRSDVAESSEQFDIWEAQLAEAGEQWEHARKSAVAALEERTDAFAERFGALAGVTATWRRGWPADKSLAEALRASRPRDQRLRSTQLGPHRADLQLRTQTGLAREIASRGQQKMLALVWSLALASLLDDRLVEPPILLLDDVFAELDARRRASLFSYLEQAPRQALLTATERPTDIRCPTFHVEQGEVQPLL